MVLIGDHKQLPPVIRSREAQIRGLNISLFERLTEEGGRSQMYMCARFLPLTRRLSVVPSIMLDMQYRMHPEISRFPSSEFYARSLKDGTVDSGGNVLAQLQPPVSEHLMVNALTGDRPSVVFLDHDGLEATKDRSRINITDAAIVCAVLEDFLGRNEVDIWFSALPNYLLTPSSGPPRRGYRHHIALYSANFASELSAQRRPGSQRSLS